MAVDVVFTPTAATTAWCAVADWNSKPQVRVLKLTDAATPYSVVLVAENHTVARYHVVRAIIILVVVVGAAVAMVEAVVLVVMVMVVTVADDVFEYDFFNYS
jgi:hypothetical protein